MSTTRTRYKLSEQKGADKGVEIGGESGDLVTPLNLILGNMSPWMRGWAPSMAYNGVHWPAPKYEAKWQVLLLRQLHSTHVKGSWCHLLPTKSKSGTLQGKCPIFPKHVCVNQFTSP